MLKESSNAPNDIKTSNNNVNNNVKNCNNDKRRTNVNIDKNDSKNPNNGHGHLKWLKQEWIQRF